MISINRFIKILISADLAFTTTATLISPVFAIFILNSIEGGSAKVAGTAIAILWVVKSILRVPVGYYLDKRKGENDDYYAMIIGFFIWGVAHYLYLFASTTTHLYAIQVLMGVAGTFAFTPWLGFFSRHIDKHHENFEWSIEMSLMGFCTALAGYVSGVVADKYGFPPLFIMSGTISLMGVFLLLLLKRNIKGEGGKIIK